MKINAFKINFVLSYVMYTTDDNMIVNSHLNVLNFLSGQQNNFVC